MLWVKTSSGGSTWRSSRATCRLTGESFITMLSSTPATFVPAPSERKRARVSSMCGTLRTASGSDCCGISA